MCFMQQLMLFFVLIITRGTDVYHIRKMWGYNKINSTINRRELCSYNPAIVKERRTLLQCVCVPFSYLQIHPGKSVILLYNKLNQKYLIVFN